MTNPHPEPFSLRAPGLTPELLGTLNDAASQPSTWRYTVVVTPDQLDGGYIATCGELPGVASQGDTASEARGPTAETPLPVLTADYQLDRDPAGAEWAEYGAEWEEGDGEVIEATDEDLQGAIRNAVESAGVSLGELRRQGAEDRFSSEDARLAWFVVSSIEGTDARSATGRDGRGLSTPGAPDA